MPTALLYPPTSDFLQKTLGAALSAGTTASATLNNVTGIQNLPGVMIIDRVDSNGVETPNTVEVVKFTAVSGSTVTTLTRGLAGTSDQDHAISAVVEFSPDIVWAQAIMDGLSQVITASGALDTTKVVDLSTAQTLTNKKLSDSTSTVVNVSDTSKVAKFSLGGATASKTLTIISSHTDNRSITVPDTTDTLVAKATTDTLSNKRMTKRVVTVTQSATPVINTDNTDVAYITGLAQAITSMTSSLSGTPVNGDSLIVSITDNGSARAITWGASFESSGNVALPTTTVLSVRLDVGFLWNTATTKWRCVAVA